MVILTASVASWPAACGRAVVAIGRRRLYPTYLNNMVRATQQVKFSSSDFWAQGINVGLACHFQTRGTIHR
jgi:hypothetical protein